MFPTVIALVGLALCFAAHVARIEYAPVVVDDLEGDVEFAGDLVGVAFVHGFGCLVFEWVDELQCGFASRPVFQARAVYPVPGGVRVLPVDELVDKGAAFLAVDELPVDEDGPGGFVVEAGHACRQERAADGDVQGVGVAAHLPVRHRRRQVVQEPWALICHRRLLPPSPCSGRS
ncbi:MAG: hypothetical protein [Bacteriophage sp.]|nr:MAG: hypothetical protein [Bacteriophage sp.]